MQNSSKNDSDAIDTFAREVYILIHRRNTELRHNKRNKKFFDRSGKEITD